MKVRANKTGTIAGLAVGAAVYFCAWLLALVVGLATWSQYHLALSSFGGVQSAFLGTVVVAGFISFAASAGFLGWLGRFRRGSGRHLQRAWILYALALWTLAVSFISWPPTGEHAEGWNITVAVAALFALLGIGMDLAMGFGGRYLNRIWTLFLGVAMATAAAVVCFLLAIADSATPRAGVFQSRVANAVHSQAPSAESLARARAIMALDWEGADAQILRLVPSEFPSLPAGVRGELERRGCTVPQPYGQDGPVNVIQGAFTAAGERDIAVLCSRDRKSSILVFRGGRVEDAVEFGSREDRGYLQHIGNNQIGFSRQLVVADLARLGKYRERYGGNWPPLEHDGIEEVFLEKASTVWYWHHGQWQQLPGAD